MTFFQKRLAAFLANVKEYQCYDIYSADSIKDLIKQRKYFLYSPSGLEPVDLEVEDAVELLENMVAFLIKYENYNIAFLTQNEGTESSANSSYYCLVKERQAIFFEVLDFLEGEPGVRLAITEPMLVKAFEDYFKDIWEQIAPVNKNKQELIQWLQSQINLLKK